MKKILMVTVAAMGLSSASMAAESFSGAYMGLNAGYGQTNVQFLDVAGRTNYGSRAAGLGFFGGYGQEFGSFYAGLEGEVSMFGGNSKLETNPYYTYKLRNQYTAAVRLGYLLTQKAMVFVKLGGGAQANTFGIGGVNTKKTHGVVLFGAGTEVMISDALSLRLDVDCTRSQYKVPGGTPTIQIQPTRLGAKVGISYRF